MNEERESNQESLVPVGNRGLRTRSTILVHRGLASLLAPQARIISFPTDHAVGKLFIRDYDDSGWDKFSSNLQYTGSMVGEDLCWEDAGEARGSIQVPARKELRLDICDEASTDLRFLDTLKPDDLHVIYLWNTHVRDADLVYLRRFTRLKGLSLSNTEITDSGIIYLQKLTELRGLGLSNTKITDVSLVQIGSLTTLKSLFLRNIRIGDIGLTHIQKLTQLKALALSGTEISDRSITYLQNLTSLEEVDLTATKVTEFGLAKLGQALPNCRIIPETNKVGIVTNPVRGADIHSHIEISLEEAARGEEINIPVIQRNTEIKLRLPKGVPDSQRFRCRGMGELGIGDGPNGDLYVIIHIKEHPVFTRKGDLLYCTLHITPGDLRNPGTIKIPTLLDDDEFLNLQLDLPQIIKPGTFCRVRGRGMPIMEGKGRGDLFIQIFY